ncbi:MAG: hypothetical protein FJ029_03935 [Actinobacteria bacterium]|nr:hypothetical protein [Actinomycetota bacterium]
MYDPDLYLLADNHALMHHWGLTRTLGRPARAADRPLIVADRPWEGSQIACWGTVVHDPADGLFKLWYQTRDDAAAARNPVSRSVICYASSRDGRTWDKPNLGVAAYRGSTAHNVVYAVDDFDLPHQLDNFVVLHEPSDRDPARRYKMLAWVRSLEQRFQMGFVSLFSPDGIRWTRHPGYTVPRLGDRMGCYRDHLAGRYVMNSRQPWRNLRQHGVQGKRQVARAESLDFVRWTEAESIIKLDDEDGVDDQFYGLTPFVWGNQYVGFLELYHRATEHLDLQLVTSRDGVHWDRPAGRAAFFGRGPDSAWDETWAAFTSNPPLVRGDEMWLYYDGRTGGHQTNRRHGAIGLATAKRDRFAGLTAGIQEGQAVTERLTCGAKRLLLNLNARCGEVAVDVFDGEGEPIPGYQRADASPVSGNHVDAEITWSGKHLAPHVGEPLYLRFWIKYGTLFAFRFAD